MIFTDHQKGRLSFVTEHKVSLRLFSSDYGRTWPERIANPPAKGGTTFQSEGNSWVDRDDQGRATAILQVGHHYSQGKSHPKDDSTGVFRRSVDGARTWIDEVAPPRWKFTVEHNGKKWLRGVHEGAIARAANGDLVAVLRTGEPRWPRCSRTLKRPSAWELQRLFPAQGRRAGRPRSDRALRAWS